MTAAGFTTAADFTTRFLGEVHPLAADFPMIGADELADLAAHIAEHGQLDPITLTPDGVLLDGRNRLAACELAEVEPKFEVHDGDPVAFIVGKNATRRQLSAGQRAMAVAMGMWETGQWDSHAGRWAQGSHGVLADARTQVSTSDVTRCGAILAYSRDTARAVLAGSKALRATYDEVREQQAEAAEQARQHDTLLREHPDLARLVADDELSLDEAWAAYLERTRKEREAAEAELANRRDTNTSLARALIRLGSLTVDASRARTIADWTPDLCAVNPEEVNPAHMRAVAAALNKLAKEWGHQ